MQILLFVLTAVLVGYVVYTFCSSNAGQAPSQAPDTEPDALEKPAPAKKPEPREKRKPSAKSVEPSAAQQEPVVESAGSREPAPTHYRNPETGDTAAVPTNYRFAKKWIKDALVAEGLLDKVYKPNELDGDTSPKVKAALDKFKDIKKYHA